MASIAYGFISAARRDDSGDITTAGTVHWTELNAGDCFDYTDASQEVNSVRAIPCADAHTYEVFWFGPMPDGDYPSVADTDAFANDVCTPAFEEYIGHDFATSVWYPGYVSPAEGAWNEGERTFLCHVSNSTETPVTGSARGSAQ